MREKIKNSILYTSVLFFIVMLSFSISSCKSDKLNPSEIFKKHYKQNIDDTKDIIREIAQLNSASRGTSPNDSSIVVTYTGEEMYKIDFEKMEQVRRDTLLDGIKMFDNSKWQDARDILYAYTQNYLQPLDDYKTALFYSAKSSLNLSSYDKAIEGYNEFINTAGEDHELMTMANWDYAICYLMVDSKKAKGLFEIISEDNSSSYSEEAKAILSYL